MHVRKIRPPLGYYSWPKIYESPRPYRRHNSNAIIAPKPIKMIDELPDDYPIQKECKPYYIAVIFNLEWLTIKAKSIKFGPCNNDKQGILTQQSALYNLHPFESYGSQHRSPFFGSPFHFEFILKWPVQRCYEI
uniref:Uncharacterized protein n=1 Tax=Romanomermis culicivorax TaxID=13658 RepID=A0A915ILL4_ROMCU